MPWGSPRNGDAVFASDTTPYIREVQSDEDWQAALAVRIAVFVDEQSGPADEEPDQYDVRCRHFVVEAEGRIVGAARLFPYDPGAGIGKIGRIALLPDVRGRGWGRLLLRFMMDQAREAGYTIALLDAQTYLLAFYEAEGFVAEGDVFMDGGIPHRRMRRPL